VSFGIRILYVLNNTDRMILTNVQKSGKGNCSRRLQVKTADFSDGDGRTRFHLKGTWRDRVFITSCV
jgi:hypothetical protein